MAIQTGSRNVPFGRQAARALLLLVLISISIVGLSAPASAEHGAGGGATYRFLDAGFSQDLVGTSNHFAGDLAWAADNDLFLSDCPVSGANCTATTCNRRKHRSTAPCFIRKLWWRATFVVE